MEQNLKNFAAGFMKQQQDYSDSQNRIRELEEENKKLKEELDYYKRKSEWFSKVIVKYQEENKKLKAAATMYRNDCKKLRAENEYLHKLLPEADGYIIEKQLEKRLWNDGEEDVYE